MTTLIAVYTNDGCVGRCDAKCYEATEPECDCICGGRNHGCGRNQAIQNTSELAQKWIEQYSKLHNLPKNAKWDVPVQQLSLFEVTA